MLDQTVKILSLEALMKRLRRPIFLVNHFRNEAGMFDKTLS